MSALANEGKLLVVGAGIVGAVALLAYFAARQAARGLAANPGALNPLSPDNIVYTGVNATGAALTGDRDFSVGVAVFNTLDLLKAPFAWATREPDLAAPTVKRPFVPQMPAWYTPETSPFMFGA